MRTKRRTPLQNWRLEALAERVDQHEFHRRVGCSDCGAVAGSPCVDAEGRELQMEHVSRIREAERAQRKEDQEMADQTAGVPEARVVRVQPGDVLIVLVPRLTSSYEAQQVRARMERVWPTNTCLVIAAEDLAVLREGE
jgi:hypothetical protein